MSLAIEVNDLSKKFDDFEAVAGVSLSVEAGEIYGFLGPNGAGKSTLVKMLTTLSVPSGGSATVLGHDIVSEVGDLRLKIGVALQDASLDEKQSGREILRLQGRLYGLSKKEADTRIDELSTLIEVDALDKWVGTYSGGMERRLDLAASLMHNPQLLFLDEPTTGLDPTSRANVWEEIRRINKEYGTTIFLTTQYLEEADVLADRVAIINKGKIVAQGTPAELKRSVGTDVIQLRLASRIEEAQRVLSDLKEVSKVEVGPNGLLVSVEQGSVAVSPIAIALDANDIVVEALTLRTPTLDDVFLEVTGDRMEVSA